MLAYRAISELCLACAAGLGMLPTIIFLGIIFIITFFFISPFWGSCLINAAIL